MLPTVGKSHSAAVVVFNRRIDGTPTRVSITLRELGMRFVILKQPIQFLNWLLKEGYYE